MPVIRTDNREFDWTSPVVIVGAGACGLTAALAVRDAGADVVVLERDATPSGSTGMSYGAICAAGTALQRDLGIDDDGEALFEDIITTTRGETDEAEQEEREGSRSGTHGRNLGGEPRPWQIEECLRKAHVWARSKKRPLPQYRARW